MNNRHGALGGGIASFYLFINLTKYRNSPKYYQSLASFAEIIAGFQPAQKLRYVALAAFLFK
jgi:hypothetical protein